MRHEVDPASVSLSHLELPEEPGAEPMLALQFDRSGNSSVYGDLAVGFTPQGGAEQVIARAAGVAVYNPNPLRRAKIALQPPAGLALARGTLRVTYSARPEAGGAVLAEGTLACPDAALADADTLVPKSDIRTFSASEKRCPLVRPGPAILGLRVK